MKSQSNTSDKTLILITHAFPFGVGEAFLESEIQYLTDGFDKVVVLVKSDVGGQSRYSASNFFVELSPLKSPWYDQLGSVGLAGLYFGRSVRVFARGIKEATRRKKPLWGALGFLLHDLLKAHLIARDIRRIIREHAIVGDLWLYSYWLTSSALGLLFVDPRHKESIVRFARAHRADLYEEQSAFKHLTYRSLMAEMLHRIFPVSADGVVTLQKMVEKGFAEKIELARLGTNPPAQRTTANGNKTALIVSCSFLAEVKRVPLIIDALQLLDLPFHWIHFGDGPLRTEIDTLAAAQLPAGSYELRGMVPNPAIIEFYETHDVDLFLNTSSSEGIPVSIMEAQSFGIPTVAFDVGGMREILSDKTGVLLSPDAPLERLTGAIRGLLTLTHEGREVLRMNIIASWNEKFNAERNFPDFVSRIISLKQDPG